MSGGRKASPFCRQSFQKSCTLSVSAISEESVAAMNSAGWCAFSQAVW